MRSVKLTPPDCPAPCEPDAVKGESQSGQANRAFCGIACWLQKSVQSMPHLHTIFMPPPIKNQHCGSAILGPLSGAPGSISTVRDRQHWQERHCNGFLSRISDVTKPTRRL